MTTKYVRFVRGWYAWELQLGPLVVQWVFPEHRRKPGVRGRRLVVWRDRYRGRH